VTLTSEERAREKTPTPEPTTAVPISDAKAVSTPEGDHHQLEASTLEASSHLEAAVAEQGKDRGQRLSLTIPGAFDGEVAV
jgi:hypothetical protein